MNWILGYIAIAIITAAIIGILNATVFIDEESTPREVFICSISWPALILLMVLTLIIEAYGFIREKLK